MAKLDSPCTLSSKSMFNHSPPFINLKVSLLMVVFFLVTIFAIDYIDVYYTRFFDTGIILPIYNTLRCFFAIIILWMIYSTGYLLLRLFVNPSSIQGWPIIDRFVLGFGIGAGFWHALLFALGMANLYYKSVMILLCLISFILSSQLMYDNYTELRHNTPDKPAPKFAAFGNIVMAILIAWLLLVRGLYPGGGGDYYTHYFYYYLNVIHNHGLAPNDVWYHYYYSKGAGLYFFGMLLTDPEAPALVTFCFVSTAALALRSIVARISPNTLWQLVCPTLYLFYNLVGLARNGGEFQKIHEETTALIILTTWAICMLSMVSKCQRKALLVMLVSTIIAGAILTQAITVYFGVYFAVLLLIGLVAGNWQDAKMNFILGLICLVSVISILFINFHVTGLATDQGLNLTWKFANLGRLNEWGVIPNVIAVAWIRDNYELVTQPFGWNTLNQLVLFTRANYLWLIITFTAFVAIIYGVRSSYKPGKEAGHLSKIAQPNQPIDRSTVIFNLSILITIFALLSMIAGHSQEVSYFRFSSFFFPLITLLCILILASLLGSSLRISIILPIILIYSVTHSWPHWSTRVIKASREATRYFKGTFSLANAYTHQQSGLSFGGINKHALEAYRHVPSGSRVWSTNVDSYCMAPNCQIESVISFKLSPHLNEILNGTPEQAKAILQSENLNYFIISKESLLLDLLPFSKLFHPDNIGKHFGIAWSDEKTYLLTWLSASNRKLDGQFIQIYKMKLEQSQHPWFRFKQALPEINTAMTNLYSSPQPWKPSEFPWRYGKPPKTGIKVTMAAYGRNCLLNKSFPYFHYRKFDAETSQVRSICNGKMSCAFKITPKVFADPARGCKKNFQVSYQCLNTKTIHATTISEEAQNKVIKLDCNPVKGINITNATLYNNCLTRHVQVFFDYFARGNLTNQIISACNGHSHCLIAENRYSNLLNKQICAHKLKIDYYCDYLDRNEAVITHQTSGKQVELQC